MSKSYKKISELIDEISMGPFGSDIKVEYFEKQGVPVLNGSNIAGVKLKDGFKNHVSHERAKGYKKAVARRGDIVITHRGTLGQIAYIPDDSKFEEYVISQSQFRVKLKSELINPIYFAYYFHTNEGQKRLLSFKSHVGVPALAQATTNFRLLDFPIRPKREQDAIANVLESIDKKIELNNRINAELETMVKTLYDYWFVQFDFPDDSSQGQGKPYKTSGGKMVYSPTLKREIPEGWSECILGDYVTFKRGISYKSGDIQDEGVPLLNLNSFSLSGKFKQIGTKYYNGKFKPESKLDAGELVIAITDVTRNADIIGKAFVIPDIFDENPLISCDVACVSSKYLGGAYLEQLFNSNSYHKYIKHFASGTLVLHLDLNGVKWFKTYLPPRNLLDKYNQQCSSLFKQRDIVLKENVYLESLRDWLLPMLMNGQVTVK